jgi:predicted RNase H-like nuclease (RuvC/YqgF family)
MREETRKRLERALFVRKLKITGAAVAVIALAAGAFYFENLDGAVVATRTVNGTVVFVGPPSGKFKSVVAQTNLQVDVQLDDTRVVHLLTLREEAPKIGEDVKIADQIHGSGRHTFAWAGHQRLAR